MAEFVDKHRPQEKLEIYEASQIIAWFEKAEDQLSAEEKAYLALIRKVIAAPEASQVEALESIKKSYDHL